MKTTKGLTLNEMKGAICIRADWYKNGENVLISRKHNTPEMLYRVIHNMLKIKKGKKVDNLYSDDVVVFGERVV